MTQPATKLVFDFFDDIHAEYARKLAAHGAPVKPTDKVDDLIVRFFCLPHRRIDLAPRAVSWSMELRARLPQLSTEYRSALAVIKNISISGGDLNPYQSRDLAKKPWKADPQLLEWGIAHFHLGLGPDAKHTDMIAGTQDLLFVVVRPDVLYFIDVLPHDSFTNQGLFDMANKNWPTLFEHAASSERVKGLEYNPTSEDRRLLRAARINVLTLGGDGRVFGPVGGGITTRGTPVHIVDKHLSPRTGPLKAWQQLCERFPERVLAMIPNAALFGLATVELHASETPDGEMAFSATNLVGGPRVLGTGYPPDV